MATLRERAARNKNPPGGRARFDDDGTAGLQISSTGLKPLRPPRQAPTSSEDGGDGVGAGAKDDVNLSTGSVDNKGTNNGYNSSYNESLAREPDVVLIHVCDEQRKENRDFRCRKDLLVDQMKYFASFLEGTSSTDDIDISVHCDLKIFEWLMKHIHRTVKDEAPQLTVNNVVSILISSDFLQMSELVDTCCHFICQHLTEIIKLPIDLNCIGPHLVSKLGDILTDDELDKVRDRRDKLVSKLYMKKLESLFDNLNDTLHCCTNCNKLFTDEAKKWMICSKSKIFIDFHGNVVAEHVPDRAWDLNAYLVSLRAKKMPWREIYWHLWGLVHHLPCSACGSRFPVSELNHCTYHSLSPIFTPGESSGYYPCCDAAALRFDTSIRKTGCCARQHSVQVDTRDKDIPGSDAATYHAVLKREALVTVPFGGGGKPSLPEVTAQETLEALRAANANGNGETKKDKISPDVEQALETYYDISSDEGADEDEASEASSETDDGKRRNLHTSSETRGSVDRNTSFTRLSNRARTAGGHPSSSKAGKKKKKKKAVNLEDMVNDLSPKKRRTWRKDIQRDNDVRRIQALMNQLESLRTTSKPKKSKGGGSGDLASQSASNLASARRATSLRGANLRASSSRGSRTGSARGTR